MQCLIISCLLLFISNCSSEIREIDTNLIVFGKPVRVEINGYSGNIMEPFISRDGKSLLFNNLNEPSENTNLHWATKITDSFFQYRGEVEGVNTMELEAVPSVDNAGNLFFVSTRNYSNSLSTIYGCNYSQVIALNVHIIEGLSKLKAGWVNFDVEVSADGQSLYFVDAQFNRYGKPGSADLVIAKWSGAGFQRLQKSDSIFSNINTDALEYAASISADERELYFTRVQLPIGVASLPQIMLSTRNNKEEIFGNPSAIESITGFAEAPAISPDKETLYFHKKENKTYGLYMIKKK